MSTENREAHHRLGRSRSPSKAGAAGFTLPRGYRSGRGYTVLVHDGATAYDGLCPRGLAGAMRFQTSSRTPRRPLRGCLPSRHRVVLTPKRSRMHFLRRRRNFRRCSRRWRYLMRLWHRVVRHQPSTSRRSSQHSGRCCASASSPRTQGCASTISVECIPGFVKSVLRQNRARTP